MKILSVIVSEVSFFVGNFLYAVEPRCLQLLDDTLTICIFDYFVRITNILFQTTITNVLFQTTNVLFDITQVLF